MKVDSGDIAPAWGREMFKEVSSGEHVHSWFILFPNKQQDWD
jgi:hypothetical protein